jgi:hypothetical protein
MVYKRTLKCERKFKEIRILPTAYVYKWAAVISLHSMKGSGARGGAVVEELR